MVSLADKIPMITKGESVLYGYMAGGDAVRKLDLSHLCFSLNFYFLMFLSQFPSMFPLLTYSQSFFPLSADYPTHSRQRRSKIQFY